MLVVVGIAFTVTACAYGVMSVRKIDPGRDPGPMARGGKLTEWLDQHGAALLLAELAVLAVIVLAAVGADAHRRRRAERDGERESEPSGDAGGQTLRKRDEGPM
jgi:hypothetical protein